MIILGIDPATGVASPTALALVDTETNKLIDYWIIQPNTKKLNHQQRVAYIARAAQGIIKEVKPDKIFVETFVMQGKGGMLLHQLIGALMAAAGYDDPWTIDTVFNTTVKRLVTGNGGADKLAVANGVMTQLFNSKETLADLILNRLFDVTDAAAIAIAGILQKEENDNDERQQYQTPRQGKKSVRKSRRSRKVKKSTRRTSRLSRRRKSPRS